MQLTIRKIIDISANAPSGGNSQPWRFKVDGNTISLIALPQKDHPILNYRKWGTFIAHGAIIENIVIAASSFGFEAKVTLFPYGSQSDVTATIILIPGFTTIDPLFSAISLRKTNRKRYKNILLSESQKKAVCGSILTYTDNVELIFIEDEKLRKNIGTAVSANEIVVLENKRLHELFFKEILWSKLISVSGKEGFYVKTMELKPPQEFIFKLLSNWKVMKLFNKIKFARKIAQDNALVYASGAGLGVLSVKERDEDFLIVGRALERLWLEASGMGLSFQIMTGVLFFKYGLKTENLAGISEEHQVIIEKAYQEILKTFSIKDKIPAIIFRIGSSDNPTALSTKKTPEIEWVK